MIFVRDNAIIAIPAFPKQRKKKIAAKGSKFSFKNAQHSR
ncbi:MAG: hypothetical protein JWR61_3739 [Ferruginibacter sp.]|jgi:hypothetical protein|nr:hypothetical protein [Ferruginibacter sp.]